MSHPPCGKRALIVDASANVKPRSNGGSMADASTPARLGWIGAGAIGLPILTRLVRAGHPVAAFDLDPMRAGLARQAGAEPLDSPAAVARASDAVFLCLPSERVVRDVVFGADGCIVGGMRHKL